MIPQPAREGQRPASTCHLLRPMTKTVVGEDEVTFESLNGGARGWGQRGEERGELGFAVAVARQGRATNVHLDGWRNGETEGRWDRGMEGWKDCVDGDQYKTRCKIKVEQWPSRSSSITPQKAIKSIQPSNPMNVRGAHSTCKNESENSDHLAIARFNCPIPLTA